jgi:hypothetical protein
LSVKGLRGGSGAPLRFGGAALGREEGTTGRRVAAIQVRRFVGS